MGIGEAQGKGRAAGAIPPGTSLQTKASDSIPTGIQKASSLSPGLHMVGDYLSESGLSPDRWPEVVEAILRIQVLTQSEYPQGYPESLTLNHPTPQRYKGWMSELEGPIVT